MKLSIIVPVYNVERYLQRCLESLVVEMQDDYEMILVDDGSTDDSGVLCDNFACRHSHLNIEVIHQSNGGVSAARNQGIEVAKGEYVTFIDSDDYIDPGTLTANMTFLIAHPEVDMLEYPVEVHAENPKAYMLNFHDELKYADVFSDWIRREGYKHCYVWNKIYAARVWKDIRFPVGAYFEDVAVMPDIIRQCQCIYYSSLGCYRYIQHSGSITTSYSYTKQRQFFEVSYRLYLDVKDDELCNHHSQSLWICCLNRLIDMGRCIDVDKAEFACIVKEVERNHPSYRTLFEDVPDVVTKLKLIPLLLLGLQTYCRLYITLTKSLGV